MTVVSHQAGSDHPIWRTPHAPRVAARARIARTLFLRSVQRLPLQGGDRLTLFSDGIIEAQPDGGAMYGLEALAQLLDGTRNVPPREVARLITQAVRDHRAADLQDDATVVILDLPD